MIVKNVNVLQNDCTKCKCPPNDCTKCPKPQCNMTNT